MPTLQPATVHPVQTRERATRFPWNGEQESEREHANPPTSYAAPEGERGDFRGMANKRASANEFFHGMGTRTARPHCMQVHALVKPR